MADCSSNFIKFFDSISLNPTEEEFLVSAQKAVERRIEKYFNENNQCPKVDFIGQGSVSMGTVVKPLAGEYDIDVGVYLRGYGNWQSEWPKPETVSLWLVNALQNHTSTPPINKRSCVRIVYKPVAGNKDVSYHVDLPIYCEYKNLLDERKVRIGIIGKGWSDKTDPTGLTDWFKSKCAGNIRDGQQLIRLVKYIKAWKDFKKGQTKFPSGMALTILMAKNFSPHTRDDISFRETIRKAFNNHFCILCSDSILKPVEPFNNVIEQLNSSQRKNFISCFEELVDEGKKAVDEYDLQTSINIWRRQFDSRF